MITEAIEANHRILLFSSYTSMFDIIEKKLNEKGIKYYKLTGKTQISQRVEMVEKFNKDKNIKIFLISSLNCKICLSKSNYFFSAIPILNIVE